MDKVEKLELAIVNVVADLLECKTNITSMLSTQQQTLAMLHNLLEVLEENKILSLDQKGSALNSFKQSVA